MRVETMILTGPEVGAVLGMEACIDAVEEAFRRWALGEIPAPGILGVHVPGGGFHIKAATLPGPRNFFAAKCNGNFPGNPATHGLPSIQGVIVLCDADDGRPLAVMDSSRITELRTAAATAVAARYLARDVASLVTLVGCGAQAWSQLSALSCVRRIRRVRVFDALPERAEAFASHVADALGITVDVAPTIENAVGACDILVTCTTSTHPIVQPGMVAAGTFIAAVGADSPHKHEIAPGLLRDAKVVVDSLTQCREIGDLHHALSAGVLQEGDVHGELGAVVAGLVAGREREEEIIVFDSTGTGLQDVAAASVAYQQALASGQGMRVDFGGLGRHPDPDAVRNRRTG